MQQGKRHIAGCMFIMILERDVMPPIDIEIRHIVHTATHQLQQSFPACSPMDIEDAVADALERWWTDAPEEVRTVDSNKVVTACIARVFQIRRSPYSVQAICDNYHIRTWKTRHH